MENEKINNISPFVEDDERFEIQIKYYKEKDDLFVEAVDEQFDNKKDAVSFIVKFKYPNAGDYSLLTVQNTDNTDNINNILIMEIRRALILIREWSLDKELNNDNFYKLHPKIAKAMIVKIRDKIGLQGLI